ncbi:MAG: TetR/AcrR family transcriptional regulator [Bacilli bacterium]|jgi:AcrR family transcriptional regulator|nr:TetR/AcrR family transcriptional regulator [Bacilli bacterium]MCH4228655.1 TetR/AcrR family transcriptional regulator [Bacilli bacterium]
MARARTDIDKQAFINASEKLITEKGAKDFSLADLAHEMGISKGTIYYHYPTKDELILDIMQEHMSALSKDYIDWLHRHVKDGITFQRFLDIIFYKGVKLFNKAKIHVYLLGECVRGNPSLRDSYTKLWDEWKRYIQEGVEQVLPDSDDKEAEAYLLMLIIDGLTIQEALGNPKPELNEKVKKILMEREVKKNEQNQ